MCTGDPEAPGELDTKEDRSGTGWQGDHPTIRRTKRGLQPYLTAFLFNENNAVMYCALKASFKKPIQTIFEYTVTEF